MALREGQSTSEEEMSNGLWVCYGLPNGYLGIYLMMNE